MFPKQTWKSKRASLTWKVNKVLTNFPLSYQVDFVCSFYRSISPGHFFRYLNFTFFCPLLEFPKRTLDLENFTRNLNLVWEQGFNQFPTVVTSWNLVRSFYGSISPGIFFLYLNFKFSVQFWVFKKGLDRTLQNIKYISENFICTTVYFSEFKFEKYFHLWL